MLIREINDMKQGNEHLAMSTGTVKLTENFSTQTDP